MGHKDPETSRRGLLKSASYAMLGAGGLSMTSTSVSASDAATFEIKVSEANGNSCSYQLVFNNPGFDQNIERTLLENTDGKAQKCSTDGFPCIQGTLHNGGYDKWKVTNAEIYQSSFQDTNDTQEQTHAVPGLKPKAGSDPTAEISVAITASAPDEYYSEGDGLLYDPASGDWPDPVLEYSASQNVSGENLEYDDEIYSWNHGKVTYSGADDPMDYKDDLLGRDGHLTSMRVKPNGWVGFL